MEQYLREYCVRRIVADIYPFDYNGRSYFITYPNAEFKFYAEKVYRDVYEKAKEENISSDNIIVLLDKYKLWSEAEENLLATVKAELDKMKLTLFENYFRDDQIPVYKLIIENLKLKLAELNTKKQSMDTFTAEYAAAFAKQRFLTGASILKPNRKRLWTKFSDWDKENNIIDTAFEHVMKNHLWEWDIRDLVKTDPWKTLWSLHRKPQSIFRKSVSDFTDEQQSLSIWSIIYDNVRKSPDCPSDNIMNDDDALDGWMIHIKRKNESNEAKKEISHQIQDAKISRAGEVFVMANSEEQARKVYEMNDFGGKIAFRKRILQIQRDKFVDEVNMIETREQIHMEANKRRS